MKRLAEAILLAAKKREESFQDINVVLPLPENTNLAEYLSTEEGQNKAYEGILESAKKLKGWGERGFYTQLSTALKFSPAYISSVLNKKVVKTKYERRITPAFFERFSDVVSCLGWYPLSFRDACDQAAEEVGFDAMGTEPILLLLKNSWNESIEWATKYLEGLKNG